MSIDPAHSSSFSSSSQPRNEPLFGSGIFEITKETLNDFLNQFEAMSLNVPTANIDMDKMLVTCGKTKTLATDGLGAGIAICARGQNGSGDPILGFWHRSPGNFLKLTDGIPVLKRKMVEAGCVTPIEVFAVGGQYPNPEEDNPGSLEEENELINIADKENIRGVKFNCSPSETLPLDVLLTPGQIFLSTDSIFPRISADYVGLPLGYKHMFQLEKEILVVTETNLFQDVPNVDMDKMLIRCGKNNYLATDSLGACIAICARGKSGTGVPVLALWHRTPSNGLSFQRGIRFIKQKMVEQGCRFESIEVFAIGGQNPSGPASPQSPSSIVSSPSPGTIEDEEELLALAVEENIVEVKFNLSTSQREPLELVLTPEKIYVSKTQPLFVRSDANEGAGDVLDSTTNHEIPDAW